MAKYTLLKNKVTGERSVRITGGMVIFEKDNQEEYLRLRKLALRNHKASERNQAMRDCGLTRVRGANGGIYWE